MNESVPRKKEAVGRRTAPTGSLPSPIQDEINGKYNEYVEGGKEEKPTNKESQLLLIITLVETTMVGYAAIIIIINHLIPDRFLYGNS